MIENLFNSTNYVAAKSMLNATMLRHEAIASNLANIETPGYKRLDVAPSFAAELQRALISGDASRIAAAQPAIVVDQNAASTRADGNTVQLESELMHLNQVALEHRLETQLITGRLQNLKLAITGRSS